MNITEDAKKRVEWLDNRIILSEQQKEYIEFQIKEAVTNALRKGQSLPIDSVSKSLPDEIYATYDKRDGEVFCAFTSKDRCKIEQEESGCGMQTIRLVKGERL